MVRWLTTIQRRIFIRIWWDGKNELGCRFRWSLRRRHQPHRTCRFVSRSHDTRFCLHRGSSRDCSLHNWAVLVSTHCSSLWWRPCLWAWCWVCRVTTPWWILARNLRWDWCVALFLVRELGPVLSALLFAGRAGSALTAEIGLMKSTEQLAAMEMMAVNPMYRVVAPRSLAGVVSLTTTGRHV